MDAWMETQEMEQTQPVALELYIPKWVEMLAQEHPVKAGLLDTLRKVMEKAAQDETMEDGLRLFSELEFVNKTAPEGAQDGKRMGLRIDVDDAWYYQMLSAMAGVEIDGEYQLISMIKELSEKKLEYEKAEKALWEVRNTGYGVITPVQEEIHLDEPTIVRQGNKYGVRIRATSPSIHLIRADIDTEISPIVGSEQQAKDLIAYINASAQEGEGIWETNIFGKSIEQLTEDGIRTKLAQVGEESRQKLQNMMQRIVNESNGGFICIIL